MRAQIAAVEAEAAFVGPAGADEARRGQRRGLEAGGGEPFPAPLPFPVLPGGIEGEYPVDGTLSRSALAVLEAPLRRAGITVKAGPFITVATITATDDTAGRLWRRYHPVMEAMEGAGTAHIARHYGIPFMEIRAGSNVVGKRDLSRWNLPLSFERAALGIRLLAENAKLIPAFPTPRETH